MTFYTGLKYVNELGGIQATRTATGVGVYLAPGDDLHQMAIAGSWGAIEAYSPAPIVITEAEVRAAAANVLDSIAASYTPQERETWAEQVAQAHAFTADNAAVTPLLDGIATGRGLTRAQMSVIILDNAAAFSTAAGAVLGKQATLIALDPIPADYADQLTAALTAATTP